MLRRTIECFRRHPAIDWIQVVIHADHRSLYEQAAHGLPLPPPIVGGASRQESVLKGLEALSHASPDQVLIHDAARPFVDEDVITRVLEGLTYHKASTPAVPVTDTLKKGKEQLVSGTVERGELYRIQTPQGFRFQDILEAHRRLKGRDLTDDSTVAEQAGMSVFIVDGDTRNFKITTQEDLAMANALITGGGSHREFRTGSGFDVHRFGETEIATPYGEHAMVMLCGIPVPHERPLEGHSDADVGLHALVDAMLGAVAEGDLGTHFPPDDEQWRGASSAIFVREANERLKKHQASVVNVDLTLICEEPRITPYRQQMRARIAQLLAVNASRVSVKATTTEKLGFLGRREGIAAQATVTVSLAPEETATS